MFLKSHYRAFTPKKTPSIPRSLLTLTAVRKRARTKALKTAVRPILKSLRSLSLAAQIDVRPCFTFNSIGQKTAIRWRDAAGTACSRCRRIVPTIRPVVVLSVVSPLDATDPAFFSIRTDLRLGARGKGRSLELSAGLLTRNCHYLSRAEEYSPRNRMLSQLRGCLSSPFHPFTLSSR